MSYLSDVNKASFGPKDKRIKKKEDFHPSKDRRSRTACVTGLSAEGAEGCRLASLPPCGFWSPVPILSSSGAVCGAARRSVGGRRRGGEQVLPCTLA